MEHPSALNGTDLTKISHQKGLDSNQLLVKNPPPPTVDPRTLYVGVLGDLGFDEPVVDLVDPITRPAGAPLTGLGADPGSEPPGGEHVGTGGAAATPVEQSFEHSQGGERGGIRDTHHAVHHPGQERGLDPRPTDAFDVGAAFGRERAIAAGA